MDLQPSAKRATAKRRVAIPEQSNGRLGIDKMTKDVGRMTVEGRLAYYWETGDKKRYWFLRDMQKAGIASSIEAMYNRRATVESINRMIAEA